MQYTGLTKKEWQREYTKLTRQYTSFLRAPLDLDMVSPELQSAGSRAARHFGNVLGKELRDTGAAQPTSVQDAAAALSTLPGCARRTAELAAKVGVRVDAVNHNTVLARTIPAEAGKEQLTHAASLFAISARLAALESLSGTLMRA